MRRYCHADDEDYERKKNVLYKRKNDGNRVHAARHRQQGGDEISERHSSAKLASVAGSIVQTAAKLGRSTLFLEAHTCHSTTQNSEPLDEVLECVRTTASVLEASLGGGLTLRTPAYEAEGQDADSAWGGLLPWPMPFRGNADASKDGAASGSRACANADFDMRDIVFETLRGSPIPPIDEHRDL